MPAMVSPEVISDVLDRLDIAEIISSYIPLKRAGRNFKAVCPFHHEKTASFIVNPDKQIYHCFGCGAGGNALSFLMQYERMEFLEALEMLAKKAGVEIERFRREVKPQDINLKAKFYKINELASFFYHKNLFSSSGAEPARAYLSERGISEKSVRELRIGLAQNRWDGLLEYLTAQNVNPSLIQKLGLIIAKDKGGFYDRFRNRIIFPILDIKSNVVGFGARVLDNSTPKYLNSPETPIYVKGEHLYGLNFSKDAIRRKDLCLVVEGYVDFLTPYSCGIDNIVASLGTALTQRQIRLIKRFSHNVVMVYDSDLAGELATMRSLDLFIDEAMDVRVVSMEKGYDPDSFIREFGKEAFCQRVENAVSLFEYKLNFLKSKHGVKSIENKAKIIDEMLLVINKFSNAVVRADYFKRLSEELNVGEGAIIEQARNIKKHAQGARQGSEKLKPAPLQVVKEGRAFERLLVRLLLQEEELVHRLKNSISASEFQDQQLAKIVGTMFELANLNRDISPAKLLHHFPDKETSSIICELTAAEDNLENKEKAVEDCLMRIKDGAVKKYKERLCAAIKDAQDTNDEARLLNLLTEFNELSKKKRG